jgi:histidinol-phosphate/aromatic aminotransferase/cobyric acid decarboxylase-like protein
MSGRITAKMSQDLVRRGVSRRDFGRIAAFLAAGVLSREAAEAQGLSARMDIPKDAVRLNSNENPMGPCPEAIEAVCKIAAQGGRYLYDRTFELVAQTAEMEGLPRNHVAVFAGSSDPLHRTVLAFTGPEHPLVMADPGYEAAEKAARVVKARTVRVPLRPDGSHDVAAMVEAAKGGGLIYLCNPNNPSGSITRPDDVAWLVANRPAGCVVLVDEAYLHYATTAQSAVPLVAKGDDVVVIRTFSKLYGMAGLRAGAAMARPDLLTRMQSFGAGALPVTGVAAAIASLGVSDRIVPERKAVVDRIREDTRAWLHDQGCPTMPSEANMLMIDVGRPGGQFSVGMMRNKVAIGRTWPSCPNHVRVTIGTEDEMARFREAFAKVLRA